MNTAILQVLAERISAAYASDPVKPVWTPFELAEQMLSTIQIKGSILVLSDLGFLPVLKSRGASFEHITFVAHTAEQELLANQMRIGKVIQVGYNDPIKKLDQQLMGLKFDIVVGNPPYNEESDLHEGKSKRSAVRLWERFLRVGMGALLSDGHLLFITPASWLGSTSTSHDLMKQYELVTANVSQQVKDAFPSVGGSMRFSWYHLIKRPPMETPTIIFDDGPVSINPFMMTFQPVRSTAAADFSICAKMAASGVAPVKWIRRDHLKQSWPFEVVVHRAKSTSHGVSVSTTGDGVGYVFGTDDRVLAEAVAHNLNLKLYRRLMWVMRSGMALVSSFTKLPIPTVKMTDEELADLFCFNDMERAVLQ